MQAHGLPLGSRLTTLLKLIFREELPNDGQILVNGRNITALPEHQIPYLRRTIGVVFQDFKLLPRRTILENVTLVLRVLGQSPQERRARAYRVLRMVGLQHRLRDVLEELLGADGSTA